MYLKEIEMQGFKSFADKTTIEFDKGVTAVVGPNGSGKSTILKSITRQLQIIGGKVYFDDRNLNSFSYKELFHTHGSSSYGTNASGAYDLS